LQFDILKIEREKGKLLTISAPQGALSVFGAETGKFSGSRLQMKKSKPKAAATKAAKRSSVRTQPANPADMRQSVTDMVESEMKNITRAVVEEAKKGQRATVKYLFEVSGVYPAAADARQARLEEGEPLARILLTRLGPPLEPTISADDEVPEKIATPIAKRRAKAEPPRRSCPEASEGSESGSVNAREEVVVSVL
jgi:hypothetical protein